ncbi:MAG: glutaminyl-peptide cyclotransferase [Flavicella sp.]
MSFKITALFSAISLLLVSCNKDIEFKLNSPKKINIDQPLTFSVSEKNDFPIDSVYFFLDGKKISTQNKNTIDIKNMVLGKHTLSSLIFSQGNSKKINNSIYFLADRKPQIYTYEIVNTFPHDSNAFTQGLEYKDGFLYESTGQNGTSSIRKTELATGKVLQINNLDKKYFGEGMTIFNDKVYQLTWQAGIGFVYDLKSFQQEKSFKYGQSKEGWGLSHNNIELIKSDGTERLWFLDPETLQEKRFIEAYTNKRKAERLNEIEYINGKIYANIWQKNTLVIIDATNGTIDGVVNLNSLKSKIDLSNTNEDHVLNGIAYDAVNDRLFVTGKNWNKTFEIKLLKK